MEFLNETVLITGGTAGIGLACAQAVLFLASPRASFITGSTLHADGGGSAV
jgi:NAD(P)-dependent dehydrogenase (short-subunit alcohol dehydrogenase family)